MKKVNLVPITLVIFAAVFCFQQVKAQGQGAGTGLAIVILASDGSLPKMHKQLKGSLDLIKVNNKGVSYIDDVDKPKVATNIGFLIAEGILFGGGGKTGYNHTTHNGAGFGNVSALPNDKEATLQNHAPAAKMNGRFYLSEELEFITKASKETSGNSTESTSLSYLQIPVLFNYIYGLQQNTSAIHGGLGVYAAIGLFGKFKGDNFSQSVHFGSSANDDLKQMDYGIAINAGYMFLKHWDVNLNYDLGLRNVSTTPPDPDTHIRGFSLNVGFWIN